MQAKGFLKGRIFEIIICKLKKTKKRILSLSLDAFFNNSSVPKQYRNFIFGSVDPNFTALVINRTSINNDLKVLENTYHGFGQKGVDPFNPGQSTIDPLCNSS